jgi:hypothetical protein
VGIPATAVFLVLSGQPVPPGAYPDVDPAVVRRLIDALKDPEPEVRQNLAAALAKIGPPSVEPLIGTLKDGVAERRAGAAYALALIGPPARTALPALLGALDDKEVEVRRQVSYAISRLIPVGRPGGRIALGPPPAGGTP